MKRTRPSLLLAFLTAGVLLSACEFSLAADITPPPGAVQPSPMATDQPVSSGPIYPLASPDPANGEAIYAEKCAACHGPQGRGDGPQASNLPNPVTPLGQKEVARQATLAGWYRVVTQGNLERYMPPFTSLSEGQRWDVVAYAFTLSTTQAELEQGQALYQANCAACHGETGKGDGPQAAGLPAPPRAFNDHAIMAERSAQDLYQVILNGAQGMPGFAGQISEPEAWSLAAYTRSLTFAAAAPLAAGEAGPETAGETTTGETAPADPAAAQAPEPALTGVVAGEVINGSGGALAAGMELILHGIDNMQLVFTQTTNLAADGTYRFENISLAENRAFLVTMEYSATSYNSEFVVVQPGVTEYDLPIMVFDTTNDASSLVVDRLHMFFDFTRPDVVQVIQLLVISNPGNRTITSPDGGPVLSIDLPNGAQNLQFQDGVLGERYLETEKGFADTFAVPPGQGKYQLLYAFEIPYERKADLVQQFPLAMDAIIVMIPEDGVSIRSDSLQEAGTRDVEGQLLRLYTGGSLASGTPLKLTLSGRPGGSALVAGETSTTGLVIGLGVLGATLLIAGVWLYRRSQGEPAEDDVDDELEAAEEEGDAGSDANTLMDAIIALDELYAAGKLPEAAYQERRAALKARLKELEG